MSNPGITNLEAWWKLDEATGTRVDAHGNNDLSENNSVDNVAGVVGNAALFVDDNSEYLNVSDNASLSTGDIDFTVGAWVWLNSKPGNMTILGKWTAQNNDREYRVLYVSATDRFGFAVSWDGTSAQREDADILGIPSTGEWYFILAWHDSVGNTLNIQVNDGAVDSAAFSSGGHDDVSDFRIGAAADGGGAATTFFDGRIDESPLYKRVLTSAERTWLYNSGNGRTYGDLLPADMVFLPVRR